MLFYYKEQVQRHLSTGPCKHRACIGEYMQPERARGVLCVFWRLWSSLHNLGWGVLEVQVLFVAWYYYFTCKENINQENWELWGRVAQSSTYSQPSVNAPSALFSWPIQTCPTAPSATFSWKLVPLPQLPLLQASCVLWVSNLPSLNFLAWHVINKSGG